MKKFYRFKNLALSALLFAGLASCAPEPLDVVVQAALPEEETEDEMVELPLDFSLDFDFNPDVETKASLLNGADTKKTGALLLVYKSSSGTLQTYRAFSQSEIANAGSSPLTVSVPKTTCDFYLLGNLFGIKKSSGTAVSLMEALGLDFPMSESELEAFVYRLDGGDINGSYRRETMAEVASYGLPFSAVEKNVNVSSYISAGKAIPQNKPTWMFSKVNITVNHGMYDGGVPEKLGYFTNKTMYMRQANLKLLPFSTGSVKAEESADRSTGDYDASMVNAANGTYTFYVPENMQGTASGVSSSIEKQANNTSIPAAIRSYGTFAEFVGTVDAGGFAGDVKYQFYLGGNSTTDFNLQRGKIYNVTLLFSSDNLFSEPEWKVDSDLSDSRLFMLTADSGFTTDIGNVNAQRMLAVRPSRAGSMYLYMNPNGTVGSTNSLLGKGAVAPSSFVMSSIDDCAWYSSFMTSGSADANWLADRGITATWSSSDCKLVFSVSNASKFASHVGEERTFTLQLLPGGTRTTSFTLKLYTDMTVNVADGKSLLDEFYLGQKRTFSVSGFSGSSIKYAAVQEKCGSSPSSAMDQNVQWKTSNSSSASFPTCALNAQGAPLLDPSNAAYASQTFSGSLDVYAWYPNRFQSSHSGWASKDGKIILFTEDWLNDSCEVTVRISEPIFTPFSFTSAYNSLPWKVSPINWDDIGLSQSLILNIDGTEFSGCDAPTFSTFDGSVALPSSSFDETLYALLLCPSVTSDGNNTQRSCAKGIRMSSDGKIYVGSTLNDGIKMEERSYGKITYNSNLSLSLNGNFYGLGICTVSGNPTTGLFLASNSFKVYLEKSSLYVGFNNLQGYGSAAESVSTNSENIYYFIPKKISGDTDNCSFEYSCEISSTSAHIEADFDHLLRTGNATSCSSKGVQYGPEPAINVTTNSTGKKTVHYVFSHENPGKVVDGVFIPTSLCLPYGPQTFTYTFYNKWDNREWASSKEKTFKYQLGYNIVMVFNTRKMSMFCTTPFEGYLLSMYGHSMSAEVRRFCLKALDRTVGSYWKFSVYLSCEIPEKLDTYNRPTIDFNDEVNSVLMTNGYTWNFGSNELATWIYNSSLSDAASFDFGPWTLADAKHFCWDRIDNSELLPAFSIAGYYRYSHRGIPDLNLGEDSENWKTKINDGFFDSDFQERFTPLDFSYQYSLYNGTWPYKAIPDSYLYQHNSLLPSLSGKQRFGRWVLFLGEEEW